jgi:hypothetical protein
MSPRRGSSDPADPGPRRLHWRDPELRAAALRWAEIGRREGALMARQKGASDGKHRDPGRPSKLGPEILSELLMAIRVGAMREDAARFARISSATLYRWLKDPQPNFARFRDLLSLAELEVKMQVTANLLRLTRVDTRAAIAWLQTRYPEEWPQARYRMKDPRLRKRRRSVAPGRRGP